MTAKVTTVYVKIKNKKKQTRLVHVHVQLTRNLHVHYLKINKNRRYSQLLPQVTTADTPS